MLKNRATKYWLLTGCLFFVFGGALTTLLILHRREQIRAHWEKERRQVAERLASTLAVAAGDALADSRADDALLRAVVQDMVHASDAGLGVSEVQIRTADRTTLLRARREEAAADPFDVHTSIPVTDAALLLTVRFDGARLHSELESATWVLFALFSGLALVGLFVAMWMLRGWMAPITELASKMEKVQQGDLRVVADEREDQIGRLARHFNEMVKGVRSARNQSIHLTQKQSNIEKFAALGRLSAGVAHEINNPVGGILTCVETMKDLEPGSERYQEYLQLVRSGLERIGKIVGQLLRFSRQSGGERIPLDLNTVLEEVAVLSRFHNRDDRVKIVRRHQPVPIVNASPDLLHQLFLNLILNALQAMPDGGTLTLSTWEELDQACVSVEDTGPGIPDEVLNQIFEPFMTTKEVGVGTGLGLSVALGIVESHGGAIEARNRRLGGASFVVRLPAAKHLKARPAPVTEKST